MSEDARREELRQFVGQLYEKSSIQKIWQGLSSLLTHFRGLRHLVFPFWLSSFIVIVLWVLVSAFVAWILGVLPDFLWENLYVLLVASWFWISISLADWQVKQSLIAIKSQALDLLELPQGEPEVLKWIKLTASPRNQALTTFIIFVLFGVSWIIGMNFDFSLPITWALLIFILVGYGLAMPHITWLLYVILFYGVYFRRWSLRLFQDNPASTIPLQILHRYSGQFLLVIALILALSVPIGFLSNNVSIFILIISIITLWIPLLVFYFVTESAFSNHIRLAKNQRLMQLQKQIVELDQQPGTPDVERIKLTRELLEFHEQIKHTPNSLVNVDSLLNLFGSLALPLLGALLNILDIWKSLFPQH